MIDLRKLKLELRRFPLPSINRVGEIVKEIYNAGREKERKQLIKKTWKKK